MPLQLCSLLSVAAILPPAPGSATAPAQTASSWPPVISEMAQLTVGNLSGLIIVVSLLIQLPLALALALVLAEKFRGAVALRMVFFLPYILAEIATGLIFSFIYDGDYGLVASIWRFFGAEAPHLLASTQTAMLAVLIVIIWKYFGFHMMLFIAALQGMDRNLVEAARIDGASRWQVLRHVLVPLL